MVMDAVRLSRDDRLGAIGDPKTGMGNHRKVIGAIADRQAVGDSQAIAAGAGRSKRLQLCFAPEDQAR